MEITFFDTLPSLVNDIRNTFGSYSYEGKKTRFIETLRNWGHSEELAQLFVSVVLSENSDTIADGVEFNGDRITGDWVRGEQTGNVGSYLKTMKETWSFNEDLSYTHKVETNEDFITTGPYFQSSYSGPKITQEEGLWAPPDTMRNEIKIFLLPYHSPARTIHLEWVEKERYDYMACKLDWLRFTKE